MVKVSVVLDGDPKNLVIPVSGEITGKIIINTGPALEAETFTIRFNGKSQCFWLEDREGRSTRQQSTHCVIDETVTVTKKGCSRSVTQIPPGRNTYSFSFYTDNLPSSMLCCYGDIHYSVNVLLKEKGYQNTWSAKKRVELVNLRSNNHQLREGTRESYKGYKLKNSKICCVPIGSISATVRLEKTTVRVGERCVVGIDLCNKSRSHIYPKVKLKRTTTFIASSASQSTVETVCTVKGLPVNGSDGYTSITLPIDRDVVLPTFHTPNIYSSYAVEVSLGGGTDLLFSIPIIISSSPELGPAMFDKSYRSWSFCS